MIIITRNNKLNKIHHIYNIHIPAHTYANHVSLTRPPSGWAKKTYCKYIVGTYYAYPSHEADDN